MLAPAVKDLPRMFREYRISKLSDLVTYIFSSFTLVGFGLKIARLK